MNCWVGIDLGSTTTKAVILGEDGEVLGRGITNSRSNYDLAAEVARDEAFITARFGWLRREVERAAGEAMLARLMKAFRMSQSLAQLVRLRELVIEESGRSIPAPLREAARATLERIFAEMETRERAWFRSPDPAPRSDFFRDAAGSAYLELAEAMGDPRGVSFDLLVALYDKCIIRVENEPLELGFRHHIGAALAALTEGGMEAPGAGARAAATGGPGEGNGAMAVIRAAVERAVEADFTVVNAVGTGYGRARLPFPREQIRSEILCHGLGAHALFPGTRTVLDIGGQDTKAIQVDNRGLVTSFQMNDRCAAGCGRYLGYIADEMNIGLHELGPLAEKSSRPVKINSTCTVFAGAELRERLSLGERREDILAGLHRAIILRAMSLLARSGGIENEFTFTGGVARNPAAVRALMDLVEENYGKRTVNISPDSIYTGALGAALFARREGVSKA